MSKQQPIFDVFVTHSHRDARLSAEVVKVLRSYDLKVFDRAELEPDAEVEDALWEAMAESQALVAVISDGESSASTTFELGAAKAWNKPVYVVAANPESARVPSGLRAAAIYPPSRIDEIAQDIRRSSGMLSDVECTILIEEFQRLALSVDQLALQPAQLLRLTKQFQKRAKRQVASEELVRMLLRLRKRGALRPVDTRKRRTAS